VLLWRWRAVSTALCSGLQQLLLCLLLLLLLLPLLPLSLAGSRHAA
jgi:hypothetical protein